MSEPPPHVIEAAKASATLYRWLDLLEVLASASSRELLGDMLGSGIDPVALRPIARDLVEEYMSDDSRYAWTDPTIETARIQDALAPLLSASQMERVGDLLAQFDDDATRAGWDWTHALGHAAQTGNVPEAGTLRTAIDEFLGAAHRDLALAAKDNWDEGWVIVGQGDPEVIATTFRIALGVGVLRQRISASRDRAGRDALARNLSEMLEYRELHPGVHRQVRGLIELLAADPVDL